MFTSGKGMADIIGEAFLLATIMMMMIVGYFVFAASGSHIEQTTETKIDYQLGEIRKRSAVTTTFNDYMWRANSIPKGKYDSRTAYKIISYYFSTPGSQNVWVNGETYSKSEVEQDIRNYLKYKMDTYWVEGSPQPVDYYLKIENRQPADRPDEIVVDRQGYHPKAEWSSITFPVTLHRVDTVRVTLWTKTSGSIYGVR